MTVFAKSQTTIKLVKLPTSSAQVSWKDYKILPALGANQIVVFGGFRPLASLE